MHNITQFGSYYALNIFFHRHRSRHIELSRTNSSLPGLQPGCYYPFPFLSILEAKTQVQTVQPHKMRFIAYHYSSLLIITQFITHHYSNSITHHYAPLHYLRWVKNLSRCLKISCHKTMHTQPLRMKIEGGGWPPPRSLCVMMSKNEIYE